ncbi:hypothetical protein [Agreia sp. Leaf283]|uniref:hypothetical protein n=1 Tax=Agreia sp. Leaf283 TaxID=1736321 RepID=UPI000725A7D6|nr:hypothetical protein [Agreia sp. Leaf283]KQP57792.1 hypothetical protein ASF51_08365 [Agreia sp. Leaf283]
MIYDGKIQTTNFTNGQVLVIRGTDADPDLSDVLGVLTPESGSWVVTQIYDKTKPELLGVADDVDHAVAVYFLPMVS